MDQVKIGRFIAECRKQQNLTQMQLAERLNITDRAVSKWETGRSMPDSAVMLDLCRILNITVNDLLSGEVVSVKEYNEKNEQLLIDMVKSKEEADKQLLRIEIFVGMMCIGVMFALVMIASFAAMADWLRIVLILIGFLPLLVAAPFMLKIEQTAGYYECAACHHRYVPTYGAVFAAMHVNRTRYMKCPVCHKRSWQRKVLTKE
ncbi:MAG: helix-turn-helix transcriptional regulator [Clostridia bacterium]|nr:helix-turn-helix transcriptional regulator [Clostridia bacterium]